MSFTLTPQDFNKVYDLNLTDEEYGDFVHRAMLAIAEGDMPEEISYIVNVYVNENGLDV